MSDNTALPADAKFSAALVAAIKELSNVPKTASNPYFKSKYAPLDAIIETTRPILAKHGLAVTQAPLYGDGCAGVSTTIIHEGGFSLTSKLVLPLKDLTPQGVGSAITYARRYSLASVLGIASEDDDDGNIGTGLIKKTESKHAEEYRPSVAKAMDRDTKSPRPAANATATWRGVEIKDAKVAAKSKEGALKKWVLYSIIFQDGQEALTFDENLYNQAQGFAWETVDAGVAPGKKDPSKWELVSLVKSEVQTPNVKPDEKP